MSTTPAPHPRVGVAAVIRNASGQLVVGKRLSSHGKGTVQFPGGHLEYGEEFFACAERETLEETGLRVKAVRLVAVTNSVFVEDCKHYITLFVLCEMLDPEATPQARHLHAWIDHPDLCSAADKLNRFWSRKSARVGAGYPGTRYANGWITTTTIPTLDGPTRSVSCPFFTWSRRIAM